MSAFLKKPDRGDPSQGSEEQVTILHLRVRLQELRDLFLSTCPQRVLTVREAALLQVCRICKQSPKTPLILNYGREYACQACLAPPQEYQI